MKPFPPHRDDRLPGLAAACAPRVLSQEWHHQTPPPSTTPADTHVHFLLEYCGGGELYAALSTLPNKRLGECVARMYAAEVLLALQYLHVQGFVYRDLKPENILLLESGHLRLTDFDLSHCAMGTQVDLVHPLGPAGVAGTEGGERGGKGKGVAPPPPDSPPGDQPHCAPNLQCFKVKVVGASEGRGRARGARAVRHSLVQGGDRAGDVLPGLRGSRIFP